MLYCSVCNSPVSQDESGAVTRTCEHKDASVIAALSAKASGFSYMNETRESNGIK